MQSHWVRDRASQLHASLSMGYGVVLATLMRQQAINTGKRAHLNRSNENFDHIF